MQDEMGGEGLRGKKQSQRDKFEGAWGGGHCSSLGLREIWVGKVKGISKKEKKMLIHRLCWLIGKF